MTDGWSHECLNCVTLMAGFAEATDLASLNSQVAACLPVGDS